MGGVTNPKPGAYVGSNVESKTGSPSRESCACQIPTTAPPVSMPPPPELIFLDGSASVRFAGRDARA